MSSVSPTICIIIPCYNEASRLNMEQFKKYADNVLMIFVDDGSTDGTFQLLKKWQSSTIIPVRLNKNLGKAEAIRSGYHELTQMAQCTRIEWIGYWDADLATPLDEIDHFLKMQTIYPEVEAIFGSRIFKLGSIIKRNFTRHLFGRIFSTVAYILLKIDSYDSQCGAKLFNRKAAAIAFNQPFITKWLFDIEILMKFKKNSIKVTEFPVATWIDVEGSKLSLKTMLFKTFFDLLKIRNEYKKYIS